jgi:plastocyanin
MMLKRSELNVFNLNTFSPIVFKVRRLLVVLAVFAVSFWVAIKPALAETYVVKMGSDTGQIQFIPSNLEIRSGDTVKWIMNKVPPHNVVFESEKIPTGDKEIASSLSHKQLLFAAGDSYSSEFSESLPVGAYPYYCEPHRAAGMVGRIIVLP